jgi:two-component system, OmpR family, sensor histidine kinase ArlS
MRKISLQWRLTVITALLIAAICIFLNFLLYRNGIYYIDSLQNVVTDHGGSVEQETLYIDIPDSEWDDFASQFAVQIYDTKAGYRRMGWFITAVVTFIGGMVTYFVSGHALKPLRDFSAKVEKVQVQNLTASVIDEKGASELVRLGDSYNKMLMRLSDAFEVQRQFTGNAAHELRTPLALMQAQLDLYNSSAHPNVDSETAETIQMAAEQTERLTKLVKTLLDMSELQTVARTDEIELGALVEEVLADLEPLARERGIALNAGCCGELYMTGSDILIYRVVFNLVENAIRYNRDGGSVYVSVNKRDTNAVIAVRDTGRGIAPEYIERVFEPFFRVDKSRSRELGGVGLGLALVREIVRLHDGSIAVSESNEEGTTFEVVFPCETI